MDLSVFQNLHGPCSVSQPAGASLEYDDRFLEMMRLSESRPEVQFGSTIVAAREPDWLQLLESCRAIASETRDLRVAVLIVEALSKLQQWSGLATGLELLESWLVGFWDCLYPLLDEDEQRDPTQRLSILSHLVGEDRLIRGVMQIPLTEHRSLGRLSLRDYNSIFAANGAGSAKISPAELEVIFSETEPAKIAQLRADIQRSIRAFSAIDRFLVDKVGSAVWSGKPLTDALNKADKVIRTHGVGAVVAAREERASQVVIAKEPETVAPVASSVSAVPSELAQVELRIDGPQSSVVKSVEQSEARVPTKILTRNDATLAIDSICDYFEKHEPASPVPLILQRAKRLIPMSFVEILHELAPKESHEFLQHLVCSK